MSAYETSLKNSIFHAYPMGLIFCLFGVLFFTTERPFASGCITLVFVLIGTFFLSVARVKPETEVLKYRVWFRWHSLPYSEVVDCGESWVFGYVKGRSFLSPWGKIYFARGYADDSLFGLDKKVISSLRKKAGIANHHS
jgi:hypothetical protein